VTQRQLDLIHDARTLARARDPNTSKDAATAIAQKDLPRLQTWALAIVRDFGPGTSFEMSKAAGQATNHRLSRRLPELERKGLVQRLAPRTCAVSGKAAAVWNLSEGCV